MTEAYWTVIALGLFGALSYLWPLMRREWEELTRNRKRYSTAGLLWARVGLVLTALLFAHWLVACFWLVWVERIGPVVSRLK